MFKPARMTRILVGGHQARMEDVIAALHEEGVLHLEDFQDPTGSTKLGSPLEAGDQASGLLVRVRGLQKAIDADDMTGKALVADDIGALVAEVEATVLPAVEAATEARVHQASLEAERAILAPLSALDVDVGALRSVTALRPYLGTVRSDPAPALSQAGIEHDTKTVRTDAGLTTVVLVRPEAAADADRVLAAAGFSAIQLPDVTGTPAKRVAELDVQITKAHAVVEKAAAKLSRVREKASPKLASLERHLAATVERTQAPLQFGVTANTFHVEGWVPRARLNRLENVLAHRFGDGLYIEDLGDAAVSHAEKGHGAAGHHHGHEGHDHDDHAHHDAAVEDEAPTMLTNKGPASKYQFLLSLLALPRYKELDPTKLIAFFFPIFFGLMVGDVIIGLLIVGIALALRKYRLFGIGGDGVAKPMMWGGIWAIAVGFLVFGEGLGMHFVLDGASLAAGEHSWESAFGIHFPTEGFLHKAGGHGAEAAIALHAEAAAPAGLFTPHENAHLYLGPVQLGYFSKIHDVQPLLVMSVLIGVVHIALGLVLGVRNVYVRHGLKLAIQEKVSWLLIMAMVPVIVLGMQSGNTAMLYGGLGVFVVAVALLWMGVQATLGAGFIALLEIPSLAGNLLSYTRLAAIGASKAGMAIAFATIGFELIGGPAGLVVYLAASLLITLLAILAGFLQSLRLQFVEFFSKFYEGGGRAYAPFGRQD